MILSNKLATIDQLRDENRFLRRLVLLMVGLLIVSILGAVVFAPRNRHTMIPPVVHQSFWVEDDRAGPEYLEEMGVFVARTYLDLTPDNIDYNIRVLLRYATPDLHGPLQAEMLAAKDRLSADNATTQVYIKEIRTDPRRAAVAVIGALVTRIAGREISNERKSWVIEFIYSSGKTQFNNIRETSNGDPFGDKPAPVRR